MQYKERYLSRALCRDFRNICDEYTGIRETVYSKIIEETEVTLTQWVVDYQNQHSELLKQVLEIFPPENGYNGIRSGMFLSSGTESPTYELVRMINIRMNVEKVRPFPYVLKCERIPEEILHPLRDIVESSDSHKKYVNRLTAFFQSCTEKYKYVDILVSQVPELKPVVDVKYYGHCAPPRGSYYSVDNFIKEGYDPKEFTQFFALCSAEGIQLNASK